MTDREGRIVLVNREIERLFGYPREELLGQSIEKLVPSRFHGAHPNYREGFLSAPSVRAMGAGRDLYGLRKDGSEVPLEIGLTPVATPEGMFVISSLVDITARKEAERRRAELEDQLRQSQKLEAVGTLAGGIAHDFNNILNGIISYAELLQHSTSAETQPAEDLREIMKAADRGRELVQQLLTFSRRQESKRRPLDLGRVTTDAVQLLRRTIASPVELQAAIDPATPRVSADATSVHQIVMNLATNGAQAMPDGGVLEIGVGPIYVRDSIARSHPDLREGPYALLSVRDHGTGIDPAIRSRVFEPFFTTKAAGAGTGLGLAMVHGIMRDHEGAVLLDSTLGTGTEVRCFFPAIEDRVAAPAAPREPARPGHGERILLVDDEPSLAMSGQRRLEWLGYDVVRATSPDEALEAFRTDPNRFDLVLTDYLMPGMTGLDLARAIRAVRGDLPIVMTTGFLEVPIEQVIDAGVARVLAKPASIDDLAAAIRATLDG
jgi:PAS domain S-box-containing protein